MGDTFLFANNAVSTLASGITNVATTLFVQPGDGALFPSPAAGQRFPLTLEDASGNIEVVHCTARSSDTFTIVRAQEGTSGLAFLADDRVELRVTKELLEHFAQKDDNTQVNLDAQKWDGSIKTVSNAAPSGGVDGDIHFEYE
jgi:hypothetical protein